MTGISADDAISRGLERHLFRRRRAPLAAGRAVNDHELSVVPVEARALPRCPGRHRHAGRRQQRRCRWSSSSPSPACTLGFVALSVRDRPARLPLAGPVVARCFVVGYLALARRLPDRLPGGSAAAPSAITSWESGSSAGRGAGSGSCRRSPAPSVCAFVPIGLVWCAVDRERRALHDLVLRTLRRLRLAPTTQRPRQLEARGGRHSAGLSERPRRLSIIGRT